MSRTVIINGREYPAHLALFGLENELSRGEHAEWIAALRRVMAEPPRPDVGAAVRAGIAAARALEPPPRNRHERRALDAKRRRAGGV
jgi:hypothetical protein